MSAASRLRGLRCDCGAAGDSVHLVGADGVADDPMWLVGEEPEVNRRRWPSTRDGVVARVCCKEHDAGGYWISIDRLVDGWERWLDHLGSKTWRGDLALLDLVEGEV